MQFSFRETAMTRTAKSAIICLNPDRSLYQTVEAAGAVFRHEVHVFTAIDRYL